MAVEEEGVEYKPTAEEIEREVKKLLVEINP